jgi:hypothetical protein
MFALKPADEFGLAMVFCPEKLGVSLVSYPTVTHPMEKPL